MISDLRVTKAFITGDGQPLDEAGTEGRWHLYWADVSDEEIDRIQAGTRHAWHAHFWRDDRLVVANDGARFSVRRHDQPAWGLPSGTGFGQGSAPRVAGFPADDSVGTPGEGWVLAAGATRGLVMRDPGVAGVFAVLRDCPGGGGC